MPFMGTGLKGQGRCGWSITVSALTLTLRTVQGELMGEPRLGWIPLHPEELARYHIVKYPNIESLT